MLVELASYFQFVSSLTLCTANISPLTAIDKFSGVRNGKIRDDVYDDCQDISVGNYTI